MARPAEPRLPVRVRPGVPHGPGRRRLLPAHPGAAPDGSGAPGCRHDRRLWSAVAGNRRVRRIDRERLRVDLALQVAAPFFNVYLVRHLGAGAGTVGLLAGVNTLFGLIGSGLFGRVMDRLRRAEDPGADGPADRRSSRSPGSGSPPPGRSGCSRPTPGSSGPATTWPTSRSCSADPRGPPTPGRWRSTRRWCSGAPWRGRSSAGGWPTRSGSRSSSPRAGPDGFSASRCTSGWPSGRSSARAAAPGAGPRRVGGDAPQQRPHPHARSGRSGRRHPGRPGRPRRLHRAAGDVNVPAGESEIDLGGRAVLPGSSTPMATSCTSRACA